MRTTVTLASVPVDPDLARRLQRAARAQVRWLHERNDLIRKAYDAGGGAREIGRHVDLSHPAILKIVGKPTRRYYPGNRRTTLTAEEWAKAEAERVPDDGS